MKKIIAAMVALLLLVLLLNWTLQRADPVWPTEQEGPYPVSLSEIEHQAVVVPIADAADTDAEARFSELMDQADYSAAVALYVETLRTDDELAVKLRRLFYQYMRAAQKESPQRVIAMANAWLEPFHADVIALLQLAVALEAVGQYNEAVETIYAVKVLGYDPRFALGYGSILRIIVSNTDKRLSARQQFTELLAFYQSLEYWELGEAADRLRMAELYYLLGLIDEAQALLEALAEEPGWQQRAEALVALLAIPAQDSASVALQLHGEHALVAAIIDYQASLKLVVDPQAEYSSLGVYAFSRIRKQSQLRYSGRRELETARGVVMVQLYTARTVQIGSYLLNNIEFAIMPGQVAASADGVLGGSALGQLDYALDGEAGQLLIQGRLPIAQPLGRGELNRVK